MLIITTLEKVQVIFGEGEMDNEFCPDCGHLLPNRVIQCTFCGWSDHIDPLAYSGYDPDKKSDPVFIRADEVYSELALSV